MKDPVDSWRLFIAIELPAKLRKRLTAHIDSLRTLVPKARASWLREENLHLTVKFFGDVPLGKVETIAQVVKSAARMSNPFESMVGGCGAFPGNSRPRVLWIGVEDSSGGLGFLHQAVENECVKAGLARDQRPYHPHLTIARVRESQGSRQLASTHAEIGFEFETVSVANLALIKSELRSGGSRHTVIARQGLGSTSD